MVSFLAAAGAASRRECRERVDWLRGAGRRSAGAPTLPPALHIRSRWVAGPRRARMRAAGLVLPALGLWQVVERLIDGVDWVARRDESRLSPVFVVAVLVVVLFAWRVVSLGLVAFGAAAVAVLAAFPALTLVALFRRLAFPGLVRVRSAVVAVVAVVVSPAWFVAGDVGSFAVAFVLFCHARE
jgi:hypothetical protein